MPDICLSSEDLATVRLALTGWAARCDGERVVMTDLAKGFPPESDTARKCLANAEASKRFAREARALLDRLP